LAALSLSVAGQGLQANELLINHALGVFHHLAGETKLFSMQLLMLVSLVGHQRLHLRMLLMLLSHGCMCVDVLLLKVRHEACHDRIHIAICR
jgi:hypothetical protein